MILRTLILLICICSVALQSKGQQLFTEIGRQSSNFDYTNSVGNSSLDLQSENHFTYGLGMRKDLSRNWHFNAGISLNKYASYGTDSLAVNSFSWSTTYLGLDLGVDLELLKKKGFSFYLRGALGPQFMLQGRQQINNENFSLKGVEQFDKPLFFLKPGIGMNHCFNDSFAIDVRYTRGSGFPMGKSGGEKLVIRTNGFTLGLLWSLRGCSYCYPRKF